MVAQPPSAALEHEAQQSPNARWNAIVTRSTNPAKRAVDVTCVVLIQLLILMILGDEKYRDTCRDCYVLAPDSVLSRLEQGDDFGLPLPMAASIRLIVRMLRAQYNLGQDYIDLITAAQAPALPPRSRTPRPVRPAACRVPHGPLPIARARASHRPAPPPIPLGHHPPPHPPPFQNPQLPMPQTHAHFVTYS